MAAAFRLVGAKLSIYFAPKPKSKAERFGLKGVPCAQTQQPVDNTRTAQGSQHPEDEHFFNEEGHGPLPVRGPPDDLGPSPTVLPEISQSGRLIDSLTPLDVIPGVKDAKSLINELFNRVAGDSEIVVYFGELKSDCTTLLEHVEELNPTSPQFNQAITKLRQELKNTLVHLEHRDSKNRLVELRNRQAIIERVMRCRKGYETLKQEFLLIQGGETLHVAQQILSQQTNSHNTALEEQIQAAEEEVQRILRRETGNNIPRELILQQQIRHRQSPALPNIRPGRFSVYKGEMMSGEKIAIKVSEVKSDLDNDKGRDFGRRTLRHAAMWSSFDSKYILPFLGMGVQIIKRQEDGKRDCYKVYFVSPWIPDGNAVNYVREARKQNSFVDVAKIVRDIALGLQYLHQRDEPCIHGSLRGENVLIKMDAGVEQACLNGFALTKKQIRTEPQVEVSTEDHICRWKAPEILDCPSIHPLMEPSSDIWSWAMTALQLYSGEEPYHQHTHDPKIVADITHGRLPSRDLYPDFEKYAPHPDATWALLEKCWKMDPEERPTIKEVVDEIDRIAEMSGASSN